MEHPYVELGALLKRWRSTNYRSALAFFQAVKPSFSYGLYATYEKGKDAAPPAVIIEVARHLKLDPTEGLLLWAKVQMPSDEYKRYFSPENFKNPAELSGVRLSEAKTVISSNQIPPSEFDNTWVLGVEEREVVLAKPWLMELLILLAVLYPNELEFKELGLTTDKNVKKFVAENLQVWIKQHRLIQSRNGIKLVQPYVYFPKSELWQPVRDRILKQDLAALIPKLTPEAIEAKVSHRTTISKYLTGAQIEQWMRKLAGLEMEFSGLPRLNRQDPGSKYLYTLLALFAERQYKLPKL